MPMFGTTLTIAYFPYFEQMSTWLNKTQNTTSLVEKTLRPSLCLKSKLVHNNIVGSPHLFTQETTIHFIWLDSVKVSIWKLEETSVARRMVRLKSFSIWDPERKTILVNFMRLTVSWKGTQFQQAENPDSYLNMDYETHLGTKIDYLLFQSSRLRQATEILLLQNQCEQERTQILFNLMIALGNSRLAGYMLTGNRSTFLETDASLAWLYHCPMVHSPLHTMSQCCDRIPLLYEGEIRFVDPMTRQTCPDTVAPNCSDRIKNLFQLDMDQGDSWYTLTPGIVHQDKPAIFELKKVTPMTAQSRTGSEDAGMYTRSELRGFWENILINAASRTAPKKFSQNLIIYPTPRVGSDGFHYYTPRTEFYIDEMYFSRVLQRSFYGYLWTGWLRPWTLWNLLLGLFVSKAHNRPDSHDSKAHGNQHDDRCFTRCLLSASYNIFLTSVMRSMYNSQASSLASDAPKKVDPSVNINRALSCARTLRRK